MARPRPGFYDTIEYIGPRPQKPRRRRFFGGWVILLISAGIAAWFGRPVLPILKATQQGASLEQAGLLVSSLGQSENAGDRLAAAALAYVNRGIAFDAAYYKIGYPNGDIAADKGCAADVLIRCCRKLGIDLQRQVHEDMRTHFREYPQLWGALSPDPSIDHRRIANLERYLERRGHGIAPSREPADYRPGDIIIWSLANAEKHIGIVVPGPGNRANEPWVVHHKDTTVKWEDVLFDHSIDARYRLPATHGD
jgi:uncharacterized protein YijF (DUF1287 family)